MSVPQKQAIPINFARGLNQKVDPFQLAAENFLALENMVFTKEGLLQKRNGFPNLGNVVVSPFPPIAAFNQVPGTISVGNTIAPFNNELVALDGMSLYSYAPDANNWIYKGRAETCQSRKAQIFQNNLNNLGADSAINNTLGITVYAWESWSNQPLLQGTLNGVQYVVVDNTTGLTLFEDSFVNTTSSPKCISISNKLYVLYFDSADNKIHAQAVSETGPGASTAIIANIEPTAPNYDALVFNSLLYVAYNGTGGTVKVASFTSLMAAVASASKAETAPNGIGIFTDPSNNAWVAYNNSTQTKAFIMDSALAVPVLAPTVIDATAAASGVHNVTGIFDGTQGIIFYDKPGSLALDQASALKIDDNGAVSTSLAPAYNTAANYVQPAVGSTVNVTLDSNDFTGVGTVIFIATGGYYYCESQIAGTPAVVLLNLGLPGNAAPATVIVSPQPVSPTNGYLNAIITYNTITSAGVVGTPATFIRSCGLASRAFLQNGFAHVVAAHDANLQPTYFLCSLYNLDVTGDIVQAHVMAKAAASEGGGIPYRSLLPSVNVPSAGVFQCALLQRTFLVENTSGKVSHSFWFTGVISAIFDTTAQNLSKVTLGKNLHLASGTLLMYDGLSTVEHNFHLFPEAVTAVQFGAGAISAGTYSYRALYSWVDNEGQIHRSAPSLNASLTCAANTANQITIPTLRVTEKKNVTIELYRTIKDGSIFFRIDTLGLVGADVSPTYPFVNVTSNDIFQVVDSAPDADIVGNQQLYTTGEVENIAAPPPLCIFEYNNRVILIPSDDPFSYSFSKQVPPGNPVEFSDLFVKNVGTIGGALTGGLRMDDKIILGKGGILYYVTGNGPASSGANDDFSDPIFITSDAGVTNFQSMVFSPIGILFKSAKGIYLLGRDLNVGYIGAQVEDFNSQDVVAAQLIPTTNQIRFMLSGGPALMYDYFFKQWGTFSNPVGVSDCIFQNQHTYINALGVVFKESPGAYVDGAGAVPLLMSFQTSWIKLAGLQGYQRAYFFFLLARFLSAHQLQLSLYTNFSSTPDTVDTITPNSAQALENWRVFFKKQRCQSFSIKLEEVFTGTNGAAFNMSGLNLIAGVKSPFRTIPAAQSVG